MVKGEQKKKSPYILKMDNRTELQQEKDKRRTHLRKRMLINSFQEN